MTEEKKIEILALINSEWDLWDDKTELAKKIEHDYIFGPLGENEHYLIDEIVALVKEVDLEKNPLPVVEEPIIEEPIVE